PAVAGAPGARLQLAVRAPEPRPAVVPARLPPAGSDVPGDLPDPTRGARPRERPRPLVRAEVRTGKVRDQGEAVPDARGAAAPVPDDPVCGRPHGGRPGAPGPPRGSPDPVPEPLPRHERHQVDRSRTRPAAAGRPRLLPQVGGPHLFWDRPG